MDLQFSYLNRVRSKGVEDYLKESLGGFQPIASNVDKAGAELMLTEGGNNVVRLSIKSPKRFKSIVTAEHEHIHSAIHQAIDKLKRRFMKINTKMRSHARKNKSNSFMMSAPTEVPIDADNIIKFEQARARRSKERHTTLRPSNEEISLALFEMALRMECLAVHDSFIDEYYKAAKIVDKMQVPLEGVFSSHEELAEDIPLSKEMLEEIKTFVETRQTEMLSRLRQKTPDRIEELLVIRGIGPRKAQALYHYFGVNGVEELEALARSHRLSEVPGFSMIMESQILEDIESSRRQLKLS